MSTAARGDRCTGGGRAHSEALGAQLTTLSFTRPPPTQPRAARRSGSTWARAGSSSDSRLCPATARADGEAKGMAAAPQRQ